MQLKHVRDERDANGDVNQNHQQYPAIAVVLSGDLAFETVVDVDEHEEQHDEHQYASFMIIEEFGEKNGDEDSILL